MKYSEHKKGNGYIWDLSEPANYKAALLDPECDKWLNSMNVRMQFMKDKEVWDLVELSSDGKTVGSKWLFKKKTKIYGAVHTYKARLVAKGYTQTLWIDYKKTFSHVAHIRAIRILIAIAANNIPMLQDVKSYLGRCFDMKDLGEAAYILEIRIYRDRSWRSIHKQDKLRLSKSQGASTSDELKRMQNFPYASATGYVFVLNGGVVDWKSAKQSIFATSSTKAEYISAYDASKEAV
nr:retrovirus-related Pol polyprotein from transposon TNT 1-94 [Tanacetum cinerariifolium]